MKKDDDQKKLDTTVEHLFRHLSGQLAATLTRIFGITDIDLAESIVQDAFLKAVEVWPYRGIPPNPAGWITTVAKNLALDLIRRQRRFNKMEPALVREYETQIDESLEKGILDNRFIVDDQLKMMLLICHPRLTPRARVSLTLKICCGFSIGEISRALLSNEETVRKMITRSKHLLRKVEGPFDWPEASDLANRIESVLDGLYLMFNEGYLTYEGDSAIRNDLCDEAIRLTLLFLKSSRQLPKQSTVEALLALMLLHSSRIPARVHANGSLLSLEDQDRSLWDRDKIGAGLHFLRESASGDEISSFHHEAHIAAAHAVSESYAKADWYRIVNHYDALFRMTLNPVVALNRTVAFSNLHGVDAALAELEMLKENKLLRQYHLLPATYADFYRRLGRNLEAREHYQKALALTRNRSERDFIQRRLAECTD